MFVRRDLSCVVWLLLLSTARGQLTTKVSGLDHYTVTQALYAGVGSETMKTHRRGPKVLVEMNGQMGSQKILKLELIDLKERQSLEWNLDEKALGCIKNSFDGGAGWNGPFLDLAGIGERNNLRQIGTEILHGSTAKVFEFDVDEKGEKRVRVWADSKSNLQLKTQVVEDSVPPLTTSEVLDVNYASPPASLFVPPKQCAAAIAGPRVPTREERIAEATSSNAQDFQEVEPLTNSKASCNVVFQVVRWGSMEPFNSGFRVGLDLMNGSHSYSFSDKHMGGGDLREVTSQLNGNSLRIEGAPAHFLLAVILVPGNNFPTSMIIGRRCFGPETTLLLVVKNDGKKNDEHLWLWVKSGKYATP